MQKYSKSDYLPIDKKEFGFVQRTNYHQAELIDEEVLELSSPFATIIASGTQVFTFLVIGDQNAGKSTFLHSFTYQHDTNFLEITSYLPILSSTFVNTRFNFNDEDFKFTAMDEPPFLDTDLARATVLVTREDFEFFLNEYEIPLQKLPDDTRYIVVQFIELGGDHLDSLMEMEQKTTTGNAKLDDILSRSRGTLLQSKKTVYFVNATTLFSVTPNLDTSTLVIQETQLLKMFHRVHYLNSILSSEHQMLFYVSRIPILSAVDIDKSVQSFRNLLGSEHAQVFQRRLLALREAKNITDPCAFLDVLLKTVQLLEKWKVIPIDVLPASHINAEDGSLNPLGIISILGKCFKNVLHSQQHPESFVVSHMIEYYKEELEHIQSTLTKASREQFLAIFWITEDLFRDYLLDVEFAEVPTAVLLQKFNTVAKKMIHIGVCLPQNLDGHSAVCLSFAVEGKTFYWSPSGKPTPTQAIRFPHYKPLFDIIENFYAKNIPPEFWLHESTLFKSTDQATHNLKKCATNLEDFMHQKWLDFFTHLTDSDFVGRVDTFFWILEEWCLCQKLLSLSKPFRLSQPLSISIQQLQ